MIVADRERWQRLSPLLDGLLDLEGAARAARLEAIACDDADMAAELRGWLADAERAERASFLAGDGAGIGEPQSHGLAGERIGAYVLEAPLGQGGSGVVWRATRADGRYQGAVAVKLLHLSLLGRSAALRFEREGAILARLEHPNIARLLDAGVTAAGQPYLVLELVEGERIDRHCDAGKLPVDARVDLFGDVLSAVAHAHRHLVVHRDIKPANILVTAGGVAKLLDFGIARLLRDDLAPEAASEITRAGGRALTPDYAAPEQLRGDDVTTATDIYSLGVLLYELLAGRHPGTDATGRSPTRTPTAPGAEPKRLSSAVTTASGVTAERLQRIAGDRATSPQRLHSSLRGDLDLIVDKAMRPEPGDRYASVDAFAEDLRRCHAGEPVLARPSSLAYRTSRFVSRHRGAVAATVLTLAAIAAGVVGTVTQARRAEQQKEIAVREAASARVERDKALEGQLLMRGTNDFLILLMRDAAGRDPGAIRKQLDRARELIEKSRFERPIVKVALLRQIAGRYGEMGDMASAVQMLDQAVASIAGTELSAPTSAVPANLACTSARFLVETGELEGAKAALDEADRLVSAGALVETQTGIECRMTRSMVETDLGHFDRGIALARAALQSLEVGGGAGEQQRVARSRVSRALLKAGRHAESLAISRPLLEESAAAQGRESMAVVRRSSIVTAAVLEAGQPLAALPLSQADEASVDHLIGEGRGDAEVDLVHGRVLSALGRYPEALTYLQRSARAAHAGGALAVALPADLASSEALLLSTQDAASATLLARIATERATAMRQARPSGIEALRIEALLALRRGDAAAAGGALDRAQALIDAAKDTRHPLVYGVALARGETLLAAGDARRSATAALEQADRALAAARAMALANERSSLVARALDLRSRSLAALGRADLAASESTAAHAEWLATTGRTAFDREPVSRERP